MKCFRIQRHAQVDSGYVLMRHSVEIFFMTHFLREGGLALNSQGDDIKKNIPVSRAMFASTVGSCSCVNLTRFLEKSGQSDVKVTSRRMEKCAQSVLLSTDLRKASSRTARDFTTFWHLVTKVAFGSQLFDTLEEKLHSKRNSGTRLQKSCERKFKEGDCETQLCKSFTKRCTKSYTKIGNATFCTTVCTIFFGPV